MAKSDANECSEIAQEAFSEEIEFGMPSFSLEYFTSRLDSKKVKMIVAEREDVVGFMLITPANDEVPAQLHLVAVDKTQRSQGIGKRLVQYAIDFTVENGWPKLKLFTRPWNVAMRKICSDLGFIQEGYLRKEYLSNDLIQYGYLLES